ncbi:hypothetical protein SmJEL517_g03084 [Synchytrium microbalum]|uniref:BTB domain-containing protein n=1 Tax=Synchytrium microbalum TaxID=1806994 RepID=A0A507BY35_9FUNG|nr:uncharacterized protein SmJEL517_g03084 [Synchytrium microbalum]TPX34230.1 hypothetical protein SmJEL517_g03084 [Synchytrium microbalum]
MRPGTRSRSNSPFANKNPLATKRDRQSIGKKPFLPASAATAAPKSQTIRDFADDDIPTRSTVDLRSSLTTRVLVNQAWEQGRYSDLSIQMLGKIYNLHKIVLVQSPFFVRLLSDDCTDLSFDYHDDRWTVAAMDIVLRDLYDLVTVDKHHRNATRISMIAPDNVLPVLSAACFIEWPDMIEYCTNLFLDSLSLDTVILYARGLDVLKPPPPPDMMTPYRDHGYATQLHTVYKTLHASLLSYVCQLMNQSSIGAVLSSDDALNENEDGSINQTGLPETAIKIMTQLPLHWLRRILESDALCVLNEFVRYRMVVLSWRLRTGSPGPKVKVEEEEGGEQQQQEAGETADTEHVPPSRMTPPETPLVPSVSVDDLGPTDNVNHDTVPIQTEVMDIDEADDEDVVETRTSYNNQTGSSSAATTPTKSKLEPISNKFGYLTSLIGSVVDTMTRKPTVNPAKLEPPAERSTDMEKDIEAQQSALINDGDEDAAFLDLLQGGIIYTYMTFDQLQLVRRDCIVPEQELFQSLWLQTALTNQPGASSHQLPSIRLADSTLLGKRKIPPFRFSVVFRNVIKSFQEGALEGHWNVSSDPVQCAGIQYRVVLSMVELAPPAKADKDDDVEVVIGSPTKLGRKSEERQATPVAAGATTNDMDVESLEREGQQQEGADHKEAGQSNEEPVAAPRELRVMLQRKSTSANKRKNDLAPIDYRIYVFDKTNFEVKRDWWRKFHQAVTVCDKEGYGHTSRLSVGDWNGSSETLADVNVDEDNEDLVWCCIVVSTS